jgi:hypothetical protein
MSPTSRTLGAFQVPAGLPVTEFDAINERISQQSVGDKTLWHAFASAWNALAYRLRAAQDHCLAFSESVSKSSAPPPEERYQQDHDLFGFVACAVSTVECFHFAAYCIGALVAPATFTFLTASNLKFYPCDVLSRFVQAFPNEAITGAMQRCLSSPEYATLTQLRDVLAHRGTPPRQHFLSTSGPDRPSAIPSNLSDLAASWRYDLELNAGCLEPYRVWLENSVRTLVIGAAGFAATRAEGRTDVPV